MKKIVCLSLILFSAGIFAGDYHFVTGGFGIDGATNQPVPTEHSLADAVSIYDALVVAPDSKGSKFVGIEKFGITCNVLSGCDLLMVTHKNHSQMGISFDGKVTIAGKVAQLITESLSVEPIAMIGATSYSVANMKCSKSLVVGGKFDYTCEFKNINSFATDLYELAHEHGQSDEQVKELLEGLGL